MGTHLGHVVSLALIDTDAGDGVDDEIYWVSSALKKNYTALA